MSPCTSLFLPQVVPVQSHLNQLLDRLPPRYLCSFEVGDSLNLQVAATMTVNQVLDSLPLELVEAICQPVTLRDR